MFKVKEGGVAKKKKSFAIRTTKVVDERHQPEGLGDLHPMYNRMLDHQLP